MIVRMWHGRVPAEKAAVHCSFDGEDVEKAKRASHEG